MHAMTPYLLESIKGKASNKKEREYFSLSDVKGHDLFDMIVDMMNKYSAHLFTDQNDKRVYKFANINVDNKNRTVSAFLESGFFGVGQPIVDINSGTTSYSKKPSEANIYQHYVQFTIPHGDKKGFALMHKSQGVGVKTIIDKFLRAVFHQKTKHALQILPYSYVGAIQEWIDNADVKKIKAKGYLPNSDPAENLSKFADLNTEYVVSAKRKKGVVATLGKLGDFVGKKAEGEGVQMLAVLSKHSAKVQTVAELNGKTKTFETYLDGRSVACDIPFDDDEVDMKDGQPVFRSLKTWSYELTNDILKSAYKKKAFQLT